FYAEIASPLLSDVKFHYLNGTVDVNSLVQLGEYNYYDGGELIVIGKLVNDSTEPRVPAAASKTTTEGPQIVNPLFDVQVTARVASGAPSSARRTFSAGAVACCLRPWCPWPWPPSPPLPEPVPEKVEPSTSLQGFIERMWAYLTVKKLLKQYELEPKDNEAKKAEALRLSLKYELIRLPAASLQL
uniref:Uncharacterized protein n=1 Tax=Romanomermis culicivorax TaxID=13658 RepID=A0A915JXV2_ROMCU